MERWKGGGRNGMVERWGEGTKGGEGMCRDEGRDRRVQRCRVDRGMKASRPGKSRVIRS